ncbi:MAG TPA: ABC transporter ATP-binding protein [Acidimicrobiales bacterium]|nr:ABC transporter ATP-binding protein [Acidimicrobiales bacterium]
MLTDLLKQRLEPYKKPLIVVVVFQTIQAFAALTLPALNADIIDNGVIPGDEGEIWSIGAVMLGMTLVQIGFATAAVYFGAKVAMSFGRDVRERLFNRVLDFSAREVGRFGAPSLITRITNDVQQVQILVAMGCTMMIAAPITAVIGVIMAVREDLGLSIVLVINIPIAVIVLGFLVSRMVPAFQLMQERVDQVNRVMREQITGIRVVRAFVREPEEGKRFEAANDDLTDVSLRTGRLMAAMFPTVMFIINMSSIGVLWVGADRISAGSMQIGALIAYLSYLIQIMMSVVMATFMMSMIPRARVAAERIQEVLVTPSSLTVPADPVRALVTPGTLEFRNVGFHYPGADDPVLHEVSFATRPGETTAIIGSTGSGKTTLVNLVPRLFDATSGAVLVGGVDVQELDPELLWGRIGFCPQKPFLFSGTVASNLRYGRPDVSEAQMWEALDVAQASDFVRAMPHGLESEIAQGGSNVSGGQRQRLAIARALVVKPEVYVFDDSFSALDLTTDARLRAALEPYAADAAKVIVAQRVSTISAAEQILVLEDGRIVGRGTHDELVAGCPTYAEIVQSQIGEREVAV